MSQHRITSVIEGDLLSVLLFLEGQRIDLSYNGSDTYRSTNTIAVTGTLDVTFIGRGVAPAAWKLTVSEGAKKLVEHDGNIGPGNISTFNASAAVEDGASKGSKAAARKVGAGKSGKERGRR